MMLHKYHSLRDDRMLIQVIEYMLRSIKQFSNIKECPDLG